MLPYYETELAEINKCDFLLIVLSKSETIPSSKITQEFALKEYYMKTSNLHTLHSENINSCVFFIWLGEGVSYPWKF